MNVGMGLCPGSRDERAQLYTAEGRGMLEKLRTTSVLRWRDPAVMGKNLEALESKRARGTKRTCQNSDCGVRFYDLGRSPILCPVCASPYVLPSTPIPIAAEARKSKKPEYPIEEVSPAGTSPPDAEVEREEQDASEEEPVLEVEEEEGGDVSNIIGGPVTGDVEEP
jgi:hypothetical protein